ncbi:MAG: hypothetical protein FWG91_00825 [Lachnospiraceae bacterium]|nr:hypothetical protein [Lachnospiraceae bacterium]
MMISLDGPKEINDLNRVFADGSGTFDKISERINRIKEIAPDYAGKLHISMVMDPQNDFDCINEICLDGSEFQKLYLSPTLVERELIDESTQFSEQYVSKMEYQNFLALLAQYGRYPKELVSPIAERMISQTLHEQPDICNGSCLLETDVPSGPCIPGQMRLFVNADGLLFPCERVSEKSPAMQIGSLDGFDLESAKRMLNIGVISQEECFKCWCFRYCNMCVKKADHNGRLSKEAKLSHCEESKALAYRKMEQFLLFKEIPQYYPEQINRKTNY